MPFDMERYDSFPSMDDTSRNAQVDTRMPSGGANLATPNSASSQRSMGSFSMPHRTDMSPIEEAGSSNRSPDSQQGLNSAPGQSGGSQDPKRSRACESCRSLKVRCEPDVNNPEGNCRRCAKAHRECIFTVPTRKRQKRTDSRVAELERKIDRLTASLNNQRRGEPLRAASTPSSTNEESPPPTVATVAKQRKQSKKQSSTDARKNTADSDNFRESEPKRQKLMSEEDAYRAESLLAIAGDRFPLYTNSTPRMEPKSINNPSQTSRSANPFLVPHNARNSSIPTPETESNSITSPIQGGVESSDPIDRKLLTKEQAILYFNNYCNNLAIHFPAVTFPAGVTAMDVRRDKPFLFLAVLAVGSATHEPELSRILNKEVIRGIADKVVIHGEKSLEIIQALVVATLWYYPPEQFEELKFYQLTHMAAVMALDCGLNRHLVNGRGKLPWIPGPGSDCNGLGRLGSLLTGQNSSILPKEFSGWKKSWLPDPGTLESRRTFLSCYFMCSNVAMSLRRPNLLRYSAYMGECVDFIENSPEATNNDRVICQWVKLQRITEEVGIAFGYEDAVAKVNLAESRVQFALKGFERQLEEWQKNLPKACETKTVRLASHTLSLFMHEIAMHGDHSSDDFRPPYIEEKLSRKIDITGTQLTQSHIDALYTCLSSAHGLLDGFLAFSCEELRNVPILFFARIAYAIVLLIKLFFSANAAKSELGKVIDKPQLKLDFYFEKLIALLKAAAADEKSKPAAKFLMILTMLSHWYQYQQRGGPAGARASMPPGRGAGGSMPATPNMRNDDLLRKRGEFSYPMSPGYPKYVPQSRATDGQMHTPHSTGVETPQADNALNADNAPTPLHMLSDVATTSTTEDPNVALGTGMMSMDGGMNMSLNPADAVFSAFTSFNPTDDNSWLTNPLDMAAFGFGDVGFMGLNLDTAFPDFSTALGGGGVGNSGSGDMFRPGSAPGNTNFFEW